MLFAFIVQIVLNGAAKDVVLVAARSQPVGALIALLPDGEGIGAGIVAVGERVDVYLISGILPKNRWIVGGSGLIMLGIGVGVIGR